MMMKEKKGAQENEILKETYLKRKEERKGKGQNEKNREIGSERGKN